MNYLLMGASFIIILLLGFLGVFLITKSRLNKKIVRIEAESARLIQEAKNECLVSKENLEKELRAELAKRKEELTKEYTEKYRELEEERKKIEELNQSLLKKEKELLAKERELQKKEKDFKIQEDILKVKAERVDQLISELNERLIRNYHLSIEDAKAELKKNLEEKVFAEQAKFIKDALEKARRTAEEKAKEVILQTIQKLSLPVTKEHTLSVIKIPDESLKGKIIGRGGRNIRIFENLTGTEVIIDDTPGVIFISSFNPLRRNIARLTIEQLLKDGQIHPLRIVQVYNQIFSEFEAIVKKDGEEVISQFAIENIHQQLVTYLGQMKFYTSYGQNLLLHSQEVAYLAGALASELGFKKSLAIRAGLLHDLGKVAVLEKNVETGAPHAEIGAAIAKEYGEDEIIVEAIATHHSDDILTSPCAFVTAVANNISRARLGACQKEVDVFIKHLAELEKICLQFPQVKKAYALQTGGDIRILVDAQKVSEQEAKELSFQIRREIKRQAQYFGEIKVVLEK